MPRPLKSAILCGALPLLFGILIYAFWRMTRSDWLMTAGMINIAFGLVMSLGGAACLSMRSANGSSDDAVVRRKISMVRKLAWMLLIANFPAALLIIASVIDVKSRYEITVTNGSSNRIESFTVSGPGVSVEFAPIPVGGSITKRLRFSADGSLDFQTRAGQVRTNGVIDGYVTPNLGAAKEVRIKPDGGIELKETVF